MGDMFVAILELDKATPARAAVGFNARSRKGGGDVGSGKASNGT